MTPTTTPPPLPLPDPFCLDDDDLAAGMRRAKAEYDAAGRTTDAAMQALLRKDAAAFRGLIDEACPQVVSAAQAAAVVARWAALPQFHAESRRRTAFRAEIAAQAAYTFARILRRGGAADADHYSRLVDAGQDAEAAAADADLGAARRAKAECDKFLAKAKRDAADGSYDPPPAPEALN